MSLTYLFEESVAKFVANESPDNDIYIAFGDDSTSTESSSSIDLDNETGRVIAVITTQDDTIEYSVDLHAEPIGTISLKEDGIFDTSSGGNLLERSTTQEITLLSTHEYHVKKYFYVSGKNDSSQSVTTNEFISEVISYYSGGTPDVITHLAFGTHLILDQCDVITSWSVLGEAGAIVANDNRKEGTKSLDLTKSGTSGTSFGYTKTLASPVDGSSATRFRIYIRINTIATQNSLTVNNAITIRIGSDSSNYKQYTWDRADLNIGWELFEVDLSSFSDTGAPDMSAIDYLYINIDTTGAAVTIAAGELLMDFWSLDWDLANSDNSLHEETVRKALTSTTRENNEVTFKSLVPTTDGNTYNYHFIALFDDASSGDMFFEEKTYLFVKDSNIQVSPRYIIKVNIGG